MAGRLIIGQRAPGEKLSHDDERLLGNLARQVAPAAHAVALRQALEDSRARLVTAREEERRRLRRDLHDGLGPAIAGLTLGLDAARTLADGQRELADLLTRLKAETRQVLADIRRIAYGLRPPALDLLGLDGALREEITLTERQAPGLTVILSLPGPELPALPAAVEVAAYRIIIEAATNVTRHADARCCRVSVSASRPGPAAGSRRRRHGHARGMAGRGRDHGDARTGRGTGRPNSRSRSLAPQGTCITARLPLGRDRDEPGRRPRRPGPGADRR